MPPVPPKPATKAQEEDIEASSTSHYLGSYKGLDDEKRRLKLTIFPLDITHHHSLTRGTFKSLVSSLIDAGSPMAAWMSAFLTATFSKVESLDEGVSGDTVKLDLHDPLTVWYVIDCAVNPSRWSFAAPDDDLEDIRIETAGQWTRGMMVIDRRPRKKRDAKPEEEEVREGATGDGGSWLINGRGNRVKRCVGSGSEKSFGETLVKTILGC